MATTTTAGGASGAGGGGGVRDARNGFPAMRIFAFGQEISEDVIRVVPAFSDNARAPATAEIVLAGPPDRYVVLESDLLALNVTTDITLPPTPTVDRSAGDDYRVQAMTSAASAAFFPSANMSASAQVQDSLARAAAADARAQLAAEKSWRKDLLEPQATLDAARRRAVRAAVKDPIKQRVLEAKLQYRVQVDQPAWYVTGDGTAAAAATARAANAETLAHLRGDAMYFPFQVGDCIFSSGDAVRIFLRDPFTGTWYYGFTGYVAGGGEQMTADNEQIVTIRCEGPLRAMRYARFTTSPGIFDAKAVIQLQNEAVRSFMQDLSGLSLPQYVWTLFFGSDRTKVTTAQLRTTGDPIKGVYPMQLRAGVHGSSTSSDVNPEAASAFNFNNSKVFLWGKGTPPPQLQLTGGSEDPFHTEQLGASLAGYLDAVDHRVKREDLTDLLLTGAEAESVGAGAPIDDVITAIGQHPEKYPVDGGRVFLLAPISLGAETRRSILETNWVGVEQKTQSRTRLARLYDALEHIEFVLHESPKGDILVEMPLYGFDPQEVEAGGDDFGTHGRHYCIPKRDTYGWDRSLNDEQIKTMMTTYYRPVMDKDTGSALGPAGDTGGYGYAPEFAIIRALVPAFGVRAEQVPPTVACTTAETAQLYGSLKLSQWNANARTVRLDLLPNLALIPNRPILHHERQSIATCRRVIQTLVWGEGGDMSTTIDVNYVRGWSGRWDGNRHDRRLYEPLGGFNANPADFVQMFKLPKPTSAPAGAGEGDLSGVAGLTAGGVLT